MAEIITAEEWNLIVEASDPKTSGKRLRALVLSPFGRVRTAAFRNPRIPKDILEWGLFSSRDGFYPINPTHDNYVRRAALAGNPKAARSILLKVVGCEKAPGVLMAAFNNRNLLSSDILKICSDKDLSRAVRLGLSTCWRAGPDFLATLSKERDWLIRRNAVANPAIPEKELRAFARRAAFIESVAMNPNCPPDLLEQILKEYGTKGARFVAANPNLPEKTILQLAQHKAWTVREVVARRSQMSEEVQRLLSRDPSLSVRDMLARNLHTGKTALRELSQRSLSENGATWVRVKLAGGLSL